MKSYCMIFFSLLVLLSMELRSADILAEIRKDLSFEIIYTASPTNINATFSKGNPKGVIHKNSNLKFEIEPMSFVNNGLIVGKDCASVYYETAGNLSPRQGTLETVVKNINWQWNDGKVHLFLSSLGSALTMYLYQHAGDGLGIYLEHPASREKIFLRAVPREWINGKNHHLAVTWNEKEIILYLDGRKAATGTLSPIVSFPRKITVGSWDKFGDDGNTTVGLLRFYQRALNEDEITALAVKELPSLKIGKLDSQKLAAKVLTGSPWFDERPRIGLEALAPDYVPAPWKPIVFKQGKGHVWGRCYDFSGKGMISGITTGKLSLLTGPVRLELNGRILDFGPLKLLSKAAGRVIGERSCSVAVLHYRLEYDGMIWCELRLNAGAKPVKSLVMIMPMTSSAAQAVHYTGVVNTLRSVVAPQHSYSHTLPSEMGEIFKRKFCTHLWVGSTHGGVQFFAESDQYWYPKGRDNIFQIFRKETEVEVRVNFVESALPASARELNYRFGFIATPVKPMPAGWRGQTISSQFDNVMGKQRGSLLVYWPDDWVQIPLDPEPHRGINVKKVREKRRRDASENRKIIPYWTRLHLPLSSTRNGITVVQPDGGKIAEEWGQDPQRQRGGSHDMMRCTSTTAWSDYLVWCVDQWAKRFGPMDGIYIDEMELTPNSRAASGGGYVGLDGSRYPTFTALADRDLYKRMHYIVRQHNGGQMPWSVAHCSGTHMMAVLSPFTVFLTGEHLYSGYFPKDSKLLPPPEDRLYYYSYSLPIDRVKTEFYWRQWGAVIAWLPCLKNQRDIMTHPVPTRDLLSRIMQADVLLWPLWCNADEIYKTIKFREEFGIGDDAVEFIPYWENQAIVTKDPQVVIGYYRNGNKILALVSNLNRHAVTLKPVFNGIKVVSMKNAETGREIIHGEFTVPRNDYIALRINY